MEGQSSKTVTRVMSAWGFKGDPNKLNFGCFSMMKRYANTKFYLVEEMSTANVIYLVLFMERHKVILAQFPALIDNLNSYQRSLNAKAVYKPKDGGQFWLDRGVVNLPRNLIGLMYDVAEGKCSLPLLNKENISWL